VTSSVLLIDTSVAVALAVSNHEHHSVTVKAIGHRPLALSGHAAFETFSVLTRLPPPIRRTPGTVFHLLSRNFPESRFLSAKAAGELVDRLTQIGIAGSAVYDALVASAALEHRLPLATRDRRATETYRALGVELEILV
jgi:predicted nucleic acid-binding protein